MYKLKFQLEFLFIDHIPNIYLFNTWYLSTYCVCVVIVIVINHSNESQESIHLFNLFMI